MSKVSTEKILTLIRDNPDLPFYVFVYGDEVDFYEYPCVLQEITDIGIDYITTCPELDDGRLYVKSWDEEDIVDEFMDRIYEEVGYNSIASNSAESIAIDKVESLNWEKCILAWASNPA